jgi:hypothetical protein
MSSSGVPRLQLDSLGGRTTPRSATSRQAALQRVFKGLDDDDHLPPRPAAAPARADASIAASNESMRSSFSAGAAITPRASRDEIERRRKVMFDSEDEDTPSQPKRSTSKVRALPAIAGAVEIAARVRTWRVVTHACPRRRRVRSWGPLVPRTESRTAPRRQRQYLRFQIRQTRRTNPRPSRRKRQLVLRLQLRTTARRPRGSVPGGILKTRRTSLRPSRRKNKRLLHRLLRISVHRPRASVPGGNSRQVAVAGLRGQRSRDDKHGR